MPGFPLGDRELTGLVAFLADPAAANADAVKQRGCSRRARCAGGSGEADRSGALLERLRLHAAEDRPGSDRAAVVDVDRLRPQQGHDQVAGADWRGSRARRQRHQEHRVRSAARRGRHRRRPDLLWNARQHLPGVRQGHRQADLGEEAGAQPDGSRRHLSGRRATVRRDRRLGGRAAATPEDTPAGVPGAGPPSEQAVAPKQAAYVVFALPKPEGRPAR